MSVQRNKPFGKHLPPRLSVLIERQRWWPGARSFSARLRAERLHLITPALHLALRRAALRAERRSKMRERDEGLERAGGTLNHARNLAALFHLCFNPRRFINGKFSSPACAE